MIFIVGDIHGEITKLAHLINNILFKDQDPEFIFIGDYIDKGENSKETLSFLMELEKHFRCTFLMGNHEYLWLEMKENDNEVQNYLLKFGAERSVASFGAKGIWETKQKITELFAGFFERLQGFWKNEQFVVVHSGIHPEDYHIPIEKLPVSRLVFNRYDFIKQEQFYLKKYRVIFGHTSFFSPFYDNFKIGIDTGACFLQSQPLSAFCPEINFFVTSDKHNFFTSDIYMNVCPNIIRNKPWRY